MKIELSSRMPKRSSLLAIPVFERDGQGAVPFPPLAQVSDPTRLVRPNDATFEPGG